VFTAVRGANLSEVPQDSRAMLLCALLKSQEEGQAHLYERRIYGKGGKGHGVRFLLFFHLSGAFILLP